MVGVVVVELVDVVLVATGETHGTVVVVVSPTAVDDDARFPEVVDGPSAAKAALVPIDRQPTIATACHKRRPRR